MANIDLLERLNAIVWEADAQSLRCSFVTQVAASLLGFSVDEWIADEKFLAHHSEPEDEGKLLEACAAVARGGEDRQLEHRMLAKDGRSLWFRTVIHGVLDAGVLLGLMVDVTQEKQIEAAMRAGEERAEAERVWLLEASRILQGSFAYEETLAEIARLSVPLFADWVAVDVLEGGVLRRLVTVPDEPAADMVTVPMVAHGETLGSIGFAWRRAFGDVEMELARDLAGRAALAIESARLFRASQEAVRRRDEFLSVASHELRTPVTALQLAVQGLLDLGSAPEPEHLELAMRSAERCSRRLGMLVHELLEVSRIDAGRLVLATSPFDLARLATDVGTSLQRELNAAGCLLTIRASAPVVGRWDRGRLEQVIANLLTNAARYAGGSPVELSVRQAGLFAQLEVSDHGIGIPLEEQQRIFERFERAAPERHYGGLGLGLYIVRRIVEAHGGTVRVKSQPGQGATFTVELP
jgi:signal transduction histidine kinase